MEQRRQECRRIREPSRQLPTKFSALVKLCAMDMNTASAFVCARFCIVFALWTFIVKMQIFAGLLSDQTYLHFSICWQALFQVKEWNDCCIYLPCFLSGQKCGIKVIFPMAVVTKSSLSYVQIYTHFVAYPLIPNMR